MSTSAESTLTAASPKPPIIRTSDLSTSPSSASPPPNDRDNDHVFYNPCNSARTNSFFSNHSTELYNSSNPSVEESTLDDSHDTQDTYNYKGHQNRQPERIATEIKRIYTNAEPYTQHSTNILIRYHDQGRSSTVSDPCLPPTPAPRSSIISSVLSNDSSTHIVQSYSPAYANTYFSNNSYEPPKPSSNLNCVGVPTIHDSNSIFSPMSGMSSIRASSGSVGMLSSTSNCRTVKSPSMASTFNSDNLTKNESARNFHKDDSRYSSNQTITSNRSTALRHYCNDTNYRVLGLQNVPQSSANTNTRGTDGRSESRTSSSGYWQELTQQTNWEAGRNARVWTNSSGCAPSGRPILSRQVSRPHVIKGLESYNDHYRLSFHSKNYLARNLSIFWFPFCNVLKIRIKLLKI